MRLPRSRRRRTIGLNMTPMIDVVFLLLVFFLWTSSFEEPEFDLPSALAQPPAGLNDPTEAAPPPEAFDEIVIVVSKAGGRVVITLNGNEVPSVEGLRGQLAEIAALGVQPPVIVDPDPQIPIGTVVHVYDAARAAGLDRVLFAAEE